MMEIRKATKAQSEEIAKHSALFIIGSIFAAISFTACSADDAINEQVQTPSNSDFPVSNVRVVESGYVSINADSKALTRGDVNEFKQEDLKIKHLTEAEAEAKIKLQGEAGDDGTGIIYKWITLNYLCKTVDGTQKELSELIVWPHKLWWDITPSQLVIGCHSTITSNEQRPTNFSNMSSAGEINMLALFSSALSQNALVIVPDYEGYGSTANYPHPYCNRGLYLLPLRWRRDCTFL